MAPTAMKINDMLRTLEEEDYKMVISYIQFLSDSRKKERIKKAASVMDQIQSMIGNDTGWDSEDDMLADMARFRKERMGL